MRRFSRSRGAAATEFALILPVLFATLIAVVDLTNLMTVNYDVQQAARDGAHVAANTTLGPDDDGSEIELAAIEQAQNVLRAAGWVCPGGVEADWYLDGATQYWVIQVQVQCPYSPLMMQITDGVSAEFTMLTQQRGLVP